MTDKQSAIVIRFAVQDGQKVTEALKKLEADGTATFRRIDAGTKEPLRGLGLLQGATDELRTRMAAAAGSAGSLGQVLAGVGVKGLALAAALGVVTAGVRSLLSTAQQITLGAEAAGLTVERFQAIRAAVVDVGGDGNRAASGLAQFAQQARAASFAQGELYEQLRLINPEFARQLATARSQAEALEVVAKAWDAAGSAQRRTALANAAFGQGGTQTMLGLRRELAGEVSPDRIIDPELVRRADELAKRINAIADALSTRFVASLGPAIALIEQFLRLWDEADRRGRERGSQQSELYGIWVRRGIAAATGGAIDPRTAGDRDFEAMEAIVRRRAEAVRKLEDLGRQLTRADEDLENAAARRGAASRAGRPVETLDIVLDQARARRLELLEARKQAQEVVRQLDAEEDAVRRRSQARQVPEVTVRPSGVPVPEPGPRRQERADLAVEADNLQRRVAVMGEAASATDRLRQVTIGLRIAQIDNVRISEKEIELVRNIARERIEAERIAVRTSLGIATAEERLAQKRRELPI